MSNLRTVTSLISLLVLLAIPVQPVALPSGAGERAHLFATCAGSYAAEAEHARLMGSETREIAEARHVTFALFLDAVLTDDLRRADAQVRLRAVRAEARLIQRQLLGTATFSAAPERRAPAEHAAARRRSACESLLLGG